MKSDCVTSLSAGSAAVVFSGSMRLAHIMPRIGRRGNRRWIGGRIRQFIGADVRAMRKARDVTLKQLASAIDRSTGWLSQLERGQIDPSVHVLSDIADFFDLDVRFFFRASKPSDEERKLVRRVADRVQVGSSENGLREEILSPGLGGSFEILTSIFEPMSTGQREVPARSTEEGGVVIRGQLILTVDGTELTLEAGDSFQFADTEYAWRNDGETQAEVIWVISPPMLR